MGGRDERAAGSWTRAGKEFGTGTAIHPSACQRQCHPGFFPTVSPEPGQLIT